MLKGNFTHVPLALTEDLVSVTTENTRYYNTPVGPLPSVTTVVGNAKRKFFEEWRKKNPEESERTMKRGTYLHTLVEKYLRNEEIEKNSIPQQYRNLFWGLKRHIDRIDNIRGLELSVWSSLLGLAGRIDCFADYYKVPSIVDYKFVSRDKSEKDIEQYFVQATAYVIMVEERYGIQISNIAIMMGSEDGVFKVVQKNPVDYVKTLKKYIKEYKEDLEKCQTSNVK